MVAGLALMTGLCGCGASASTSGTASTPPNLTAPPSALRWESFNNVAVPISSTSGPTDDTGPAATGYARTPQGAALAAINGLVRCGVATDDQIQSVAALVAPGTGRDTWLMNRELEQVSAPPPASAAPTVLGYTISDYTPLHASLHIVTRQPDSSLTGTTAQVVWRSNDWKLAFPDDPHAPSAVTALSSLPPHVVTLRR